MPTAEDVEQFRGLLTATTAAVTEDYFLLPVADAEGGEGLVKYRERVYAYELYHQLRTQWPQWRYSLAGEVDKRNHPVIRHGHLKNVKPDLIVHVPARMDHNLVVVEIKTATPQAYAGEEAAIEKDLQKLSAFCAEAMYTNGILLAFGQDVDRVRYARTAVNAGLDLRAVELWHHSRAPEAAQLVAW